MTTGASSSDVLFNIQDIRWQGAFPLGRDAVSDFYSPNRLDYICKYMIRESKRKGEGVWNKNNEKMKLKKERTHERIK